METPPRPDLYVLVRLLETVRARNRTLNRTQLQVASGMNYSQFQKYLLLATGRGLLNLVSSGGDAPLVELTAKGYDSLMFLARGLKEVVGVDLGDGHA
jgi:predicted transcriptional regulator